MNVLQPIGRMFIAFLVTVGRLAADGNLHPSEKVCTPWVDTLVPVAE